MANSASAAPVYQPLPDIFRAAREDNADMLRAALGAGESLGQIEADMFRNPIHIAVLFGARSFIAEAIKHPSADLWARDRGGLRPLDLCWLKNDFAIHDILQPATYYPGWFLEFSEDGR